MSIGNRVNRNISEFNTAKKYISTDKKRQIDCCFLQKVCTNKNEINTKKRPIGQEIVSIFPSHDIRKGLKAKLRENRNEVTIVAKVVKNKNKRTPFSA